MGEMAELASSCGRGCRVHARAAGAKSCPLRLRCSAATPLWVGPPSGGATQRTSCACASHVAARLATTSTPLVPRVKRHV